jgi:hypothetical protein
VVIDVKNVMGMLAVVMAMWWWFIWESSIFAKRRGCGSCNAVESVSCLE